MYSYKPSRHPKMDFDTSTIIYRGVAFVSYWTTLYQCSIRQKETHALVWIRRGGLFYKRLNGPGNSWIASVGWSTAAMVCDVPVVQILVALKWALRAPFLVFSIRGRE